MNLFDRYLNKKIILFVSFLGTLVFVVMYFLRTDANCGIGIRGVCSNYPELITLLTLQFVPVFVFSLLTCKLNQRKFRVWVWFTLIVLITGSVILLSVSSKIGNLGEIPYASDRHIFAFYIPIIYSVLSALMIGSMWTSVYFENRKLKK